MSPGLGDTRYWFLVMALVHGRWHEHGQMLGLSHLPRVDISHLKRVCAQVSPSDLPVSSLRMNLTLSDESLFQGWSITPGWNPVFGAWFADIGSVGPDSSDHQSAVSVLPQCGGRCQKHRMSPCLAPGMHLLVMATAMGTRERVPSSLTYHPAVVTYTRDFPGS